MWSWLIGIVVFVVIWGTLWRSQPKLAFGVLLGLPIAWILSLLVKPYTTGAAPFPVWLVPLAPGFVALTLLVFGVIIWFRADNLPPPRLRDDAHDDVHAGHGGH
jgi:hypothetical protein